MALVFDIVDPQELIGFARGLQFAQFNLDRFLPNDPVADIEYEITSGIRNDVSAASFRAWDTESPIGSRQGVSRQRGAIPPVSQKIRLGEEERLRLQAVRSGGDQAPIIEAIYRDTASQIRAVQARIELARGQALSTGTVAINENGLVATADFGVPAEMKVTAAVVHSDPTASVIQEWTSWLATYRTVSGGLTPGGILTSSRYVNSLLRNDEIRTLAGSLAGTPNLVTRAGLDAVFAAYGLPPFITHDEQIRVDGVAQRVIPDHLAIPLPPAGERLGATLYGVTAEALELQAEGQLAAEEMPGVVAVVEKTFDPVATWTKGAGVSFPTIVNPELLMIASVLTPA